MRIVTFLLPALLAPSFALAQAKPPSSTFENLSVHGAIKTKDNLSFGLPTATGLYGDGANVAVRGYESGQTLIQTKDGAKNLAIFNPSFSHVDTPFGIYMATPLGSINSNKEFVPFIGSQDLLNIRTTKPANGMFSSSFGTYIDYCSYTGCLQDYPGILAQTYVTATSRTDNAQEVGLHVDFRSKTGYAPVWKNSTAYTGGDTSTPTNVSRVLVEGGFAGRLYRNVSGPCVSAASGAGPQSTDPNVDVQDGSCVWRYIADGLNNGKSGFSVATVADAGAAQTWGVVTAFNAGAGIGDSKMFPHEWDCNNYNKDSFLGGSFFMNCFYFGGGGGGTFPQLSTMFIDNANKSKAANDPTRFGYHYGMFFSGSGGDGGSVVKDAVIFDSTKADYTIYANAGQPHKAFLRDDSASEIVLQATNFHNFGIDFSNALFTTGVAMALPSTSYITFKSGLGAYLGYNNASQCLTYGKTNSGVDYLFQSCDNSGFYVKGDHTVQSGLVRHAQYTVAGQPPCGTGTRGAMIVFTDVAGTPTYRQTGFSGGGSQAVPGFCNGSSWELH